MSPTIKTFERELIDALPVLRLFSRRLCRDRDDADDLLQDACVLLVKHQRKFELGTNFAAWAKTIMKRAWLGELKREKVRSAIFVAMDRVDPDADDIETFEGVSVDNPERAIIVAEQYDALALLKPEVANILVDAGLGVALDDIAARFALPVNTISSHVRRGRAQLVAATGGL